jgi:hypothetical protein
MITMLFYRMYFFNKKIIELNNKKMKKKNRAFVYFLQLFT